MKKVMTVVPVLWALLGMSAYTKPLPASYVGIWVDPTDPSDYFQITHKGEHCSSLHRNCAPIRIQGSQLQMDAGEDGTWRQFYTLQKFRNDTMVVKKSDYAETTTSYIRLSPTDSALRFADPQLDSAALLNELRRFQQAVITGDKATLKSFFRFPIRGETANTLWIAALGDNPSPKDAHKTSSNRLTESDFDKIADSLFRRRNDLKSMKALKIKHFADQIATCLVRTGKLDSTSTTINYDFDNQTIHIAQSGKYFMSDEEGWYDKSSWIFIFAIKDRKSLIFVDLQGAG